MHGTPRYPAGFKNLDYVNPEAPKGGTLRRAETGTFDNLNPFLITGRVTPGLQEALLLTYDSLMVRAWNEPFTMYGLVAASVDVPPERDWIEFHLDPAARFHDGQGIASTDVQFSYKTLMQYGRPNQRRIYKLVREVIIKDEHTIRFNLGPGFDRETVMILAGMPVLPMHYWQNHDFSKTTLEAPLASGPYRIASVDVGRRVVFERVKDYWAKDKPINRGLYNFNRLQYDFFRDDNVALQALSAGQADLRREWSPVVWQRDYHFSAVANGKVKKEVFKNGRPVRAKFMIYNLRRAPFDRLEVRKAIALALDFDWLNRNLFLDTQTRIDSIFMNSELADQSVDKFQPPEGKGQEGLRGNLRQAIALLKQAGFTLREGRMLSQNGRQLHFEILLNDPNDEKIALAFTRNLRRIGIDVAIRTVDTAQYIGRMSQFDFDMTINFWRNSLSPGTEQAVYWGSAAADNQGSFNYTGLKSPVVDGLITRLTSAKKREDLVNAARRLDHEIMKSWIGVPLYDSPDDRIAYRLGLKHPDLTPLYGPVVESWWYDGLKSAKEISNDSKAH
ncbi:MAG: transporter, periplasmic substrate-binding protein [Alphaproteobacteria bacterium]|nr:transporter, periplasmic substrate-binding protein [Alphaproteobacteria bacterium]